MLEVANDLNETLYENYHTDIIYWDFSKAFDSVSHHLLSHKFQLCGSTGNLMYLFTDNLRSREHLVCVDCYCSEWLSVVTGVPQESILGPLLFLVYINDINSCISNWTKLALFGDYAKIDR